MIEESVVRTVIEHTDIVRLISEYVQLKQRGRTLVGLCPFHTEKTPSFHVNGSRGTFHCFGCSAGGSAVDFLMRIESISFPEAIERLAERLGIAVDHVNVRQNSERAEAKSKARAMLETMKTAQAYFAESIKTDAGSECLKYAHQRGITDAMIASFEMGFSPDSWDGIVDYLRRHKQSLEEASALGLVAARDTGGYYARFRNRLMFPVHNERGEIIAFGGRILGNAETAKYINSPESAIYTKGNHLYGLYQAKMHITREHCAILVEGNVDAVMMHAFGFCHTVASMGTALTPKQASLLFRHTRKLYVMYDGDNAGRKAMCRALPILLGYDFEGLFAVELPREDDPDSYLRTYGAEGMAGLIESAKSLGQWCIEQKCSALMKMAPELRKAGFAELSDLIHGFNDPLAQRHYLEQAARLLGQDVRRLAVELGMNVSMPQTQPQNINPIHFIDAECAQYDRIEWIVVSMLLASAQRYEEFVSKQYIDLIQDPGLRSLLCEYQELPDKDSSYAILAGLTDHSRQLYEKLICTDLDVPETELNSWFDGALAKLIIEWAARERHIIGCEIARAVRENDSTDALIERDRKLLELMKQSEKERRYHWQNVTP